MNKFFKYVLILGVAVMFTGCNGLLDVVRNTITGGEGSSSVDDKLDDGNLAGIDSNGDGVRDDIEDYINKTYPNSEKTRKALMQIDRGQQMFILASESKGKAIEADKVRSDGLDCLFYVIVDGSKAAKYAKLLEGKELNTYERLKAANKSDAYLSGMFFTMTPTKEEKFKCDFNPDELKD